MEKEERIVIPTDAQFSEAEHKNRLFTFTPTLGLNQVAVRRLSALQVGFMH